MVSYWGWCLVWLMTTISRKIWMLLEREAQERIKNKLAALCTERAKQMLGLIQSPLS